LIFDSPEIRALVQRALDEDVGAGDVTTEWTIPPDQVSTANFMAKEEGVVAGLDVARLVFELVDPQVEFEALMADGDRVSPGDLVARVRGATRSLLSGERLALNFLQRLSGIATLTRRHVDAIEGYKAVMLDTRKTTPGLRTLEKYAVRMGGGTNHRYGLFDMVLIKDNHIQAAGGIAQAVERVRERNVAGLAIEVEVRTFPELDEVLELDVDRVMLDNMTCDEMSRAVALVNGRVALEASGNVTLERVRDIAETGVDFISSGSLTHSAKALDLSMKFVDGD
jgi:nicotinate-nucleotide pyrophosphorylase (carboxylating)